MSARSKITQWATSVANGLKAVFLTDEPSAGAAILPLCLLSVILFTRHPTHTNFIFDEQEALLANPYVRSVMDASPKFLWRHAFTTDFWGRLPEATIGSYRPLPNLVWRCMWWLTCTLKKLGPANSADSPFLCHWINVLLHGVNGALITGFTYRVSRKRDLSWFAGALFVSSAVLTEAVSGVVGLSDVLGGLGALIALYALTLPLFVMPLGVFLGVTIGMYSKESALCCVPLIPIAAALTASPLHILKPRRIPRGLLAFVAAFGAFVLYVQMRKHLFPTGAASTVMEDFRNSKPEGPGRLRDIAPKWFFQFLLKWYAQPALPRDSFNNPLVEAEPLYRIAGALRVYARGIGQIVFPWRLSGDYSSPQEPIPSTLVFPASLLGAFCMVFPFVFAPVGLYLNTYARKVNGRRREWHSPSLWGLGALAGLWIVLSYFPVSNIPILLPTVRAERFWYFPAMGTSILIAMVFSALRQRTDQISKNWSLAALVLIQLFIGFQLFSARKHANDYRDDLTFWSATRKAVPNSAKAHLNYSVMLGARSRYDERLVANERALVLEPTWGMANVYLGDTLCRMHRAPEAVPHYLRGFEIEPNGTSLIALALQCLWDEKLLTQDNELAQELSTRAADHPGSWYADIVSDLRANGDKNNGVAPKHRPRGYNEGPKE
jgi:hypothetical protein